jgi:hypothetical protein
MPTYIHERTKGRGKSARHKQTVNKPRVANFPLPTYSKWENGKSVGKWENGLGNGKMGKHNGRSGQTHVNVRLRHIETCKIDAIVL